VDFSDDQTYFPPFFFDPVFACVLITCEAKFTKATRYIIKQLASVPQFSTDIIHNMSRELTEIGLHLVISPFRTEGSAQATNKRHQGLVGAGI